MIPIDDHTVVAENFGDLSSILTANNQYTYVYLGVDINMTSGIRLHNDRTLLVIDGEYPQGSGTIQTLTDASGNLGMIYKNNVSPLDITFQNVTIAGRNYYGMPRIDKGNENVSVTYRNVTYTGPQITWHWSGTTRYIDCDITILDTGYSNMNEVAEARWVEIGGKTVIRHNNGSASYSVFNFLDTNASLTILEDAEVEISTYNDFFEESSPPRFIIEPRASFTLTTRRGISRSASNTVSSFLVDEDASFRYIQESNAGENASLYIDGAFTVNVGARVYMQADYASTSDSRRLIQFTNSSGRGLYLNSPKSFVLYNQGQGKAINFSSSTVKTPFTFFCGQVNYWLDARLFPTAGTFDDPPLYQWHSPNWNLFEIRGAATSSLTSDLTSTLATPFLPDLPNLQLHNARVLSVGDLPLTVDPMLNIDSSINGRTDPGANVKVEYIDESGAHIFTGTADSDGYFSIPTPEPIPLGTKARVSSNVPFLITWREISTQEVGRLSIEEAPALIRFTPPLISQTPRILGREVNEHILVKDARAQRTEWELLATIDGPMRAASGHELANAVVFVPEHGAFAAMIPLSVGATIPVYIGGPGVEDTSVVWDDDMGILMHLNAPIHLGEEYTVNVTWTVRPMEP
ncbi:MAG: hypothetical protein LBL96_08685 [Clostridiales bacterium]|nr:hypothetical protein [Clostridiales bacterium]